MELTEKLADSLPIAITDEDVEKNPEFCKLLDSLAYRLTSNGMTRSLDEELNAANEELKKQKFAFLQQRTVLDELKEYLTECESLPKNGSTSIKNNQLQLCKIVSESLMLAELNDYVNLGTTKDGTKLALLGVSCEHLSQLNPCKRSVQQYLSSVQQVLIPEIETRLRKRCENLAEYYNPNSQDDGEPMTFANITELPELIERDKRRVDDEKANLTKVAVLRRRKFWQYYQEIQKCIEILDEIIRKYRLKYQADHDTITCNWFAAKCDAMCNKLSVLANHLLKDSYTNETVSALNQIKHHLVTAQAEVENELTTISESLRSYEAIGMGFDKIVLQYAEIAKSIDEKRWALSQINESSNHT
ncbi:HAUS augmin-like complex subunit 4 [Trichoplax sp. H2]|nr:HAUS augmin-like complex subunit 4 [Trichoplax sp. H2]|eukprot:RDD46921.1 HAUS augmin-like complex subunit 4 [Trichoplax sp. H2]